MLLLGQPAKAGLLRVPPTSAEPHSGCIAGRTQRPIQSSKRAGIWCPQRARVEIARAEDGAASHTFRLWASFRRQNLYPSRVLKAKDALYDHSYGWKSHVSAEQSNREGSRSLHEGVAGPTHFGSAPGLYATRGGGAAAHEAFHYTFGKAVSSIEKQGRRAGSYATPNGALSPLQAHIDLALPANRGLPDALLRVDLAGLRRAGYEIPQATQAGRMFGMPGGGMEMRFPYPIPPEFIKAVLP